MNAPDRTDFLARRRSGLGGSDIPVILGLSPWSTPLQLWMEKTGREEPPEPDADAAERMHWGTVLEDVVARHYAESRDVRVQRINGLLRHAQVEIALANIDRAVVAEGTRARWDDKSRRLLGAEAILECKTAHAMARSSADWGDEGTDQVPQHYWTQCQWYAGIAGVPYVDLAVLFGGQKFVTYRIEHDAALFGDLLAEADRWWNRHVVGDVPPEPNTEADARRLWRSHATGRDKIVDVTVADAVDALIKLKAEAKALEQREQELRDAILPAFGDAESISYRGRKLATWKANKASARIDWQGIVNAAIPDASALIEQHTVTQPGARVLRLAAIKE